MSYFLFILPPAEKDLDRLSRETYQRIRKSLLKLEQNPRPPGALKLTGEEGYRIRAGAWRVLYRIDDSLRHVVVYRVKHRREVYR